MIEHSSRKRNGMTTNPLHGIHDVRAAHFGGGFITPPLVHLSLPVLIEIPQIFPGLPYNIALNCIQPHLQASELLACDSHKQPANPNEATMTSCVQKIAIEAFSLNQV